MKDIIGGIDSVNKLEAYKSVPSPPRHTIISIFDNISQHEAVVVVPQNI